MDYKKTETEIVEATKEFATINNIHYDELTESMILNAMRELNKCFIADVIVPFVCDNCQGKECRKLTRSTSQCKKCHHLQAN